MTQPSSIENGCYALEVVHETDLPLLKSVPRAYILTLHETDTFEHLHGIASKTYIQRNQSFKVCHKTREKGKVVTATNQDLIHAYANVLSLEEGRGYPFLIFEDDAQLTQNAREDWPHLDSFISSEDFSVYFLGCSGFFKLPHGTKGHWRLFGIVAYTHAVVYSPSAPSAILEIIRSGLHPRDHFDVPILSKLKNRFTYHRPIAFQSFDSMKRSENSKTWNVNMDMFFYWNDMVYGGLHSESGWHVMYRVHQCWILLLTCISLFVIVCIALAIYR